MSDVSELITCCDPNESDRTGKANKAYGGVISLDS